MSALSNKEEIELNLLNQKLEYYSTYFLKFQEDVKSGSYKKEEHYGIEQSLMELTLGDSINFTMDEIDKYEHKKRYG